MYIVLLSFTINGVIFYSPCSVLYISQLVSISGNKEKGNAYWIFKVPGIGPEMKRIIR
jgi:hypothetical protein